MVIRVRRVTSLVVMVVSYLGASRQIRQIQRLACRHGDVVQHNLRTCLLASAGASSRSEGAGRGSLQLRDARRRRSSRCQSSTQRQQGNQRGAHLESRSPVNRLRTSEKIEASSISRRQRKSQENGVDRRTQPHGVDSVYIVPRWKWDTPAEV